MNFSYLCWSGLCDGNKLDWSKDICEKFGLDMNKLPKIVDTFDIIGYISKKSAGMCGLIPGIPVAAGGGDGSVTALGVGLNKTGMTAIIAGTAGGIYHTVDKIYSGNKYRYNNQYSVFKDLKFLQNYDLSGKIHSWFIEMILSKKGNSKVFLEIEKKLSRIPQCSEKLIFLPSLTGQITPYKPYIRGAWIGLDLIHTKEHLYKSILESVAFKRYLDLQIIEDICKLKKDDINEIKFIGGGSKSRVWSKIYSDVLGRKVIKYERSDFATLGSALIAAKAVGEIENIDDNVKNSLKVEKEFYPDKKKHKKYIEFLEIYEEALQSLDNVYRKLNEFNTN